MKIFINILSIIFLLIVFTTLYFLIERSKKSDYITRKNYPKLLIETLEGITYTLFGLVFQVFFYKTAQFSQPYFYISIGLTLIFLRGAFISCISIIGSLLYSLFIYPIDKVFYYIIAIMFVSMTLTILFKPFVKAKFSLLINSIFLLANIFILWGISSTQLNYEFTIQFVLATLLPFLLPIILITLISYLLRFLQSANLLYESSTYDTLKFYRESISAKVIQEMISMQRVSEALFVIMEMNWSKELENERNFEKKALEIVQNNVSQQAVLFKVNSTQYGFFLPTKKEFNLEKIILENKAIRRTESNSLKRVENLMRKMEGEYSIDGINAKLKMRAGVVAYGLQEHDVFKMQSQAEFALEYSRWNKGWNRVVLFDPKAFKKRASDYIAIKTLDNSIGVLSISNEFTPIYSLKTSKTAMNIALPITTDVLDVKYASVEEYAEYMGYKSVLLSYNAAQALKMSNGWKSNPLVIYYPLEKIMSKDFDADELIASFRRFNQTKRNVILSLDSKVLGKFNSKEVLNRTKTLKNKGILFAIFNFNINNQTQLIAKIKPHYIFLEKSIYQRTIISRLNTNLLTELLKFAKAIKTQVIAHAITKESELKLILSTDIEFIGGPIFNRNEIEPTFFNKKSKIYIEQIQKEKK
ncbi:MAG: EAL domain-containing protein [Mycoplasmatales bacterium]|nr:EAL domain-containing protein [Mycoplasmatales bacterium]